MSKESYFVYLMDNKGRYGKPVTMTGAREAAEYAALQAANYPEIRVCDILDRLVFHIKNGKIVFPEPSAAAPVNAGTAPKQPNARPIPYVVFVADLPTLQGDLPELALPFAHAIDVDEAIKMVEEAYRDESNYVVLDAMDYNRLMEIADMLEEEEPSYSREGEEVERRLLDIGWAVRRLKKGVKVRFNTWGKGEHIENRDGRIVDRTGTPWRPSQEEILSSGWEVADATDYNRLVEIEFSDVHMAIPELDQYETEEEWMGSVAESLSAKGIVVGKDVLRSLWETARSTFDYMDDIFYDADDFEGCKFCHKWDPAGEDPGPCLNSDDGSPVDANACKIWYGGCASEMMFARAAVPVFAALIASMMKGAVSHTKACLLAGGGQS